MSDAVEVLNLYAGIGGNRKLWGDVEDVNVTAVELNEEVAEEYRRLHPDDDMVVADAHKYLQKNHADYDYIWSSPPCQSHSTVTFATCQGNTGFNATREPEYPDMNLYQEIVFLRNYFDGDWAVENVNPYYEPLIQGQHIDRHLFWSNYYIPDFNAPERDFEVSQSQKEQLESWLGLRTESNIYMGTSHDPAQVLRNCVHPELGKHVFAARGKQTTLGSV